MYVAVQDDRLVLDFEQFSCLSLPRLGLPCPGYYTHLSLSLLLEAVVLVLAMVTPSSSLYL